VEELVTNAKSIVARDKLGKPELWRAYVDIEYAILDLKLRHKIEHEQTPPRRGRKETVDVALARSLLDGIDLASDEKKLLYDLRACRDVLKSLVASYERRSTTS
jgi:hypothetical protein